jgi:hypothetical protein
MAVGRCVSRVLIFVQLVLRWSRHTLNRNVLEV